MMRALGRVILLPVAFIVAALAAGFVILSLGQEKIVHALTGRRPDEVPVTAALDLVSVGLSFLSVTALVPALLVVIVGEVARIRGALYYVAGGGAALAVVPLLTRLGQPGSVLDLAPAVWHVLATAGFAGGFVYWLLAGRNA
jgi:hypothetical protein